MGRMGPHPIGPIGLISPIGPMKLPTPITQPGNRPPAKPALPELWQLLIQCRDEKDQERLYRELEERGYRCRVLIL